MVHYKLGRHFISKVIRRKSWMDMDDLKIDNQIYQIKYEFEKGVGRTIREIKELFKI